MGLLADAARTVEVKAALIGDERIAAGQINVSTSDGVVTLHGKVPYEAIRQLAELAALRHGATRVINELEVEHPEYHAESAIIPDDAPQVTTTSGAEPVRESPLEERVREALAADPRVNEHLAVVQVENRVAFLSGRQGNTEAWAAATETSAHVPGIVAVENDMEVIPSV